MAKDRTFDTQLGDIFIQMNKHLVGIQNQLRSMNAKLRGLTLGKIQRGSLDDIPRKMKKDKASDASSGDIAREISKQTSERNKYNKSLKNTRSESRRLNNETKIMTESLRRQNIEVDKNEKLWKKTTRTIWDFTKKWGIVAAKLGFIFGERSYRRTIRDLKELFVKLLALVGISTTMTYAAGNTEQALEGVRKEVGGTTSAFNQFSRELFIAASKTSQDVDALASGLSEYLSRIHDFGGESSLAADKILEFSISVGKMMGATNLSSEEVANFGVNIKSLGLDFETTAGKMLKIRDISKSTAAELQGVFSGVYENIRRSKVPEETIQSMWALHAAIKETGASGAVAGDLVGKLNQKLYGAMDRTSEDFINLLKLGLGGDNLRKAIEEQDVTVLAKAIKRKFGPDGELAGMYKIAPDKVAAIFGLDRETVDNILRMNMNKIDEFKKELARADASYLNKAFTESNKTFSKEIDRFKNVMSNFGKLFGTVFLRILIPPFRAFNWVLEKILELFSKIQEWSGGFALTFLIITTKVTIAFKLLKAFLMLGSPLVWIVNKIEALFGFITGIGKGSGKIATVFRGIGKGLAWIGGLLRKMQLLKHLKTVIKFIGTINPLFGLFIKVLRTVFSHIKKIVWMTRIWGRVQQFVNFVTKKNIYMLILGTIVTLLIDIISNWDEWVERWRKFSSSRYGKTLMEIGSALLGIGGAILTIVSAVKLLIPVWNLFSIALASNPIGAILAGVGLLITAGWALYQNWDTVSKWFGDTWDSMFDFKETKEFIKNVNEFWDKIFDRPDWSKYSIFQFFKVFKKKWGDFWKTDYLHNPVKKLVEKIENLFKAIFDPLKDELVSLIDSLPDWGVFKGWKEWGAKHGGKGVTERPPMPPPSRRDLGITDKDLKPAAKPSGNIPTLNNLGITDKDLKPAGKIEPLSLGTGDKALLERIAHGEGTSDVKAKKFGFESGYDIPYGYGKFVKPEKPLSQMTIGEIKEFQSKQITATKGTIPGTTKGTGAVGKYQVTQGTLAEVQKKLGFSDKDLFTPELQDQIGLELLKRRGYEDWKAGKISDDVFQRGLSKEWASIASPTTGRSAHGQGVGTTTAQIREAMRLAKEPTIISEPPIPYSERTTITQQQRDPELQRIAALLEQQNADQARFHSENIKQREGLAKSGDKKSDKTTRETSLALINNEDPLREKRASMALSNIHWAV